MTAQCFVVVGAGHAGAAAAVELRQAGFAGRILLIGDEPHLPYERPPLSKAMLMASDAEAPLIHQQARLDEANVELLLGRTVIAIDADARQVSLDGGQALSFDKLLLAPGGIARALPVPGGEHALVLRSLGDARRLQARITAGSRVAVVGAGVIGLEVAASAASLGATVIVVERAAGPMARSAHPDIQAYIDGLHRRHGVDLRYGAELQAIEQAGDALRLAFADGTSIDADVVVAGIGLAPNLDLARGAGLAVSSGITVDQFGATSVPGIYAAGDAASFWHPALEAHVHWQTWQHAQNHGKSVARAMVGDEPAAYRPTHWFWSDQHGVNMQFTGLTDGGDEIVVRGDPAADKFVAFHRQDGLIVGATFVNSGGMVRPTQAMIAGQIRVPAEALADPAIPLQKLAKPA